MVSQPPSMIAYFVGVLAPIVFVLICRRFGKGQKRGLPVDVGGEPGYAIRNRRFTEPFTTA